MDPNKMVKVLFRRTREARARLAQKYFGWEAVVKAIDDAAMRGHESVLIEPPDAFDLSGEKAAMSTVMRLRAECCAVEWVASQKFATASVPVVALRVSWSAKG